MKSALPIGESTAPSNAPASRPSLRIEMVLPALHVGGMEVMVARLMRGLRQRGHDVGATCLESKGPMYEMLEGEGFRMSLVPSPGWLNMLFPRTLAASFRAHNTAVAHIHSGAWVKAAKAAKLGGVGRVIYTQHGMESRDPWYERLFSRYAAAYTDEIVAVSEELRRYMQGDGGLAHRRIEVLPNGVPVDTFSPNGPQAEAEAEAAAGVRARFGIPHDAFLIGNIARLWPVKNHKVLLEAFSLLRRRHDSVYLVLVGDGVLRAEVEAHIDALDLRDRVFLTGEMHDLPGVYRELDLFALSSLNEGTSISMLEAMASGVGVVATAVGGNPRLLENGKLGLLVPSDEPSALATGLEAAMTDSKGRRARAVAAREYVVGAFSEDAMCDAYEALYFTNTDRSRSSLARSQSECVG